MLAAVLGSGMQQLERVYVLNAHHDQTRCIDHTAGRTAAGISGGSGWVALQQQERSSEQHRGSCPRQMHSTQGRHLGQQKECYQQHSSSSGWGTGSSKLAVANLQHDSDEHQLLSNCECWDRVCSLRALQGTAAHQSSGCQLHSRCLALDQPIDTCSIGTQDSNRH